MFDNVDLKFIEILNEQPCVFFGTGRLAQEFYGKYCENKKIINKPIFWCDNDRQKQGDFLEQIEIISPERLFAMSEEYYCNGKKLAIVIAATGNNLLQIICQFEQAALKGVVYSATQIEAMFYFKENIEKVNSIKAMFADDKSRQIYMQMINNIKLGRYIDFSLAEPNQYIENDVIPTLGDEDIIVDAGVCNGEEIDKALNMNGKIQIYAFEPDRQSMKQLKSKYENNTNIILCEYALWNEEKNISFTSNETAPSASRINENEQIEFGKSIHAMPLDDVIKGKVSLIKMDIEGAEYNALQGAQNIIQEYKPKLAICVYHNIEDYVRIPLLIHKFNPKYKFYFRQHSITTGESVFYAV